MLTRPIFEAGGLPSDWHRILRLMITWAGGAAMCGPSASSAFRGVLVWWVDDVVNQYPGVVADVSPRWGRRASVAALELRPSGARQQLTRRKREHHDHEACGTGAHQRRAPPPFEEEQRNHPGRHHLPDRIMLRGHRDARFRSGYLVPVGCDRGTVTHRNSDNANTRGREGSHHVLRRALHH